MRHRSRAVTALVALWCALTLVAGCSGQQDDDPKPSGTDASSGPVKITFADGDVTPKGERVQATVGEPVTFEITADEPGELHLHSRPEQEVAYEAGTSTHEVTIDTPGTIEVESHELDALVIQLQVNPK